MLFIRLFVFVCVCHLAGGRNVFGVFEDGDVKLNNSSRFYAFYFETTTLCTMGTGSPLRTRGSLSNQDDNENIELPGLLSTEPTRDLATRLVGTVGREPN